MPQTRYTNADLARFARPALGVTIERAQPEVEPYDPSQEVDVDQLLANAKGTLARANEFSAGLQDEYDLIDESNAARPGVEAQNARVPSVMDSGAERLNKLVMHYLRTRPEVIEQVAPFAAMAGGPIGMAGQVAFAGSSAKNLVDDEPDSALGTGLNVLGLVGGGAAALKGLKGLLDSRRAAQAAQAAIAAKGAAAGEAAETRHMARQLGNTGYAPGAVKKITGVGLNEARNFSKSTPISHNASGDYIGRVMDEVGAQNRQGNAAVAAAYDAKRAARPARPTARPSDPLAGLRRAETSAWRPPSEGLLDNLLAGAPDDPILQTLKRRLRGEDPYNTVLGPGARR